MNPIHVVSFFDRGGPSSGKNDCRLLPVNGQVILQNQYNPQNDFFTRELLVVNEEG